MCHLCFWPGIKSIPPALEIWSLNHWIARKVPSITVLAHFPQWIYSIPTLYHNRIVSYSVNNNNNNNNNNTSSYELWLFSAFFRFRGCSIVYVISTGFWIRFGFKTNVCYLLTINLGQSSRLWWTFFLLVSGKDIATHSVAPRNLEIIFDFSFPFAFHIPQICSFSRIYTTNISQIHLLLT